MNPTEKQTEPFRTRLEDLRAELEKGQRHLELLDHRREEVRETLLRISGAIQVLEELLPQSMPRNGEAQVPPSDIPEAHSEASSRVAM